ncbi:zinc finger protein 839 isoform X2 [Rana temporaria]|uniref:zinc finger protein 839 isoform X2 n=1 Tax=Rana temporaria TaxID=8407 RepID=UPI001AAD1D5A|nr:zinc finger protein 839 isoform X2 [Rana temporaria]
MAAPSGHDKMATEEYMQVVVGGELEPGQQVVVLQDSAAGEEMRATSISSELLQSIAHTDTVYYVQPDGSLVAGGTLAEVTGGGGGAATVRAPVMLDAALQLKNVADHVALKQGAPSQMARILSQKMKSICVQVQGMKSKESSEPVIAKENPPLPVNTKSDNASVVPTQVVQAKTAPPQPPQPLVVKAAQPPVQVLMQKTATRPAKVNTPDPDGNEGEDSTEEHGCCVAHHRYGSYAPGTKKKGQKRKKPIKIKTRSGRISRPPKHKSKDYKFLKVGDSIQDSSVDSDDYSELSSEDEDDGGKERVYRDRQQPYAVKNSLFQCQKCEKSYMGKGGLFRHYRLYPAHGQMDPSFLLEAKIGGDGGGTGEQKKPVPRPRKRLLEDPANPGVSTKETLARDGLEIVKVTTSCRGRRQLAGRRFGRPRKILRNGTVEEHSTTVKELIQQCEEKDLKEQVAPSFTKLLSVYDFLLLKVKEEHVDNKPLFPYVYREFEKLHSMVKNLAEDYVINMDQNVEKPLEVTDSKVAESLGISKVMTVKAPSSSSSFSVTVEQETRLEENKHESSDEEAAAPPPKRMKIHDDSQDVAEDMTVGIDAAHCGGLGYYGSNQVMLHSETDPGTVTDIDAVKQATAQNDFLVEGTESLQTQADTETDDLQEPLPSPESADFSQSQDHPLNLSCQVTEEILRLQTHVIQNFTQEMAEAEPPADLPPGFDPQTEAEPSAELPPGCDPHPEAEPSADLPPGCDPQMEAEPSADLPPGCDPQLEVEPSADLPPGCDPQPEAEPSADLPPGCDPQLEVEPSADLPPGCDPQPEAEPSAELPPCYDPQTEAEPSAELPPGCDPQTDSVDPEIPCDGSLFSVEDSQVEDHTRTFGTSVPTTLAEAMCSEAPQMSFVEVGGTLIPTTSTFTMGSLDLSGISSAFSLSHGQELVYIQSTEESTTEEEVVIFDNTGATETHSGTVVALVEM